MKNLMFIKETVGTDAEGVWAPDIEQSFQVNILLLKFNFQHFSNL